METANAQPPFKLDHLEAYIQSMMEQWHIPGLSLAIVKDGNPVVIKGYGTKESDKDLPINQHTLFPISAGTRLFTASAIALLVVEEKLEWGEHLTQVMTALNTGSLVINEQATVLDALAERIGLPMGLAACASNPQVSRAELLSRLRYITKPNGFRDGQGSGLLLSMAAGEIIPALTGISWDDFVQKRLFKPLGMTSSLTSPLLLHTCNNVASPHERVGQKLVPIPPMMSHNLGGAFSIYSCAADMAKWLQFQLDNGTVTNAKGERQVLIPPLQIEAMRNIHMATALGLKGFIPELSGYGLGSLVLTSHNGYRVYCTGGDTEGTESFYGFIPEINLGIAVLVNTHQAVPHGLLPWILDRFTGAPERDWVAEILQRAEARKASKNQVLAKQKAMLTQPSCPPSLPLGNYAGIYQHPYLGEFTVRQTGQGLSYTFGEIWQGELPHANHNTFYREPVEPAFHRSQFKGPLRFNLSFEGTVESLTIPEGSFQKLTA